MITDYFQGECQRGKNLVELSLGTGLLMGSPLPSYLAVSDSGQLPCQHWLLQHPLRTPPGCTLPQRLPCTPHTQKAALEGTSVLTTLVQAAGPLPWGLSSPFPSFKVS